MARKPSPRRRRSARLSLSRKQTTLLVAAVCLLLGIGFVIGMRYAGTRVHTRTAGKSGQYLDDSWKRTTERFEKPAAPKAKPPPERDHPQVAIVIDDLGPNLKYARRLLDLDPSITLAVIPWQVHSAEIVQLALRLGAEVILHQPMEARNQEGSGMPGMLYLRMTDREIRETLDANLDTYAGVSGINNHMGSAFTEDERALGVVFDALRDRGLYFLDSRTSAETVGRAVGRVHGLPVYERDVFLDNESEYGYMSGMWNRFLKEARGSGNAILIAHGRTDSIEFLEARLPELRKEGFRLRRLSALYKGDPDAGTP